MTATTRFIDILWRRIAGDESIWRDLGDGFVVYHRPSGKTHLLNDASHRLLTELLQEPKNLQAIAAEFVPATDRATDSDYPDSLAQMLRRLEQFGLIERV